MATVYPGTKQTFTNPVGTNLLDNPDHAGQHADINDTVEAVQDTVGTSLGTNVLSNFSAGQFPLRVTGGGATGTHVTTLVGGTLANTALIGTPQITGGSITNAALIGTSQITGGTITNAALIGTSQITGGSVSSAVLANDTIGTPAITGGTWTNPAMIGTGQITGGSVTSAVVASPTITTPAISNGTYNNGLFGTPTFVLGSDATGDLFYRTAGGTITRLGAGTLNHVLTSGGIGTAPTWAATSAANSDGWVSASGAWTCTGVDATNKTGTITVDTDLTSTVGRGMRIKFTQGGSTIYGLVSIAPTIATGTTTLKIYTGTQTGSTTAITAPSYSTSKYPFGFPQSPSDWSVSDTSVANDGQASPTQNTWYNSGGNNISIPIGLWIVEYQCNVSGDTSGSQTDVTTYTTLSTGTASESNSEFTAFIRNLDFSAIRQADGPIFKTITDPLSLTSATIYYLNIKTGNTGLATIGIRGDVTKTFIRARSALL